MRKIEAFMKGMTLDYSPDNFPELDVTFMVTVSGDDGMSEFPTGDDMAVIMNKFRDGLVFEVVGEDGDDGKAVEKTGKSVKMTFKEKHGVFE